jgi:hypothetical protein
MTTGRVGKQDLFKAIKSWAPKGAKLHEALKTAAEFGVKKRIGGSITKGKAAELMQQLKSEHVLKSRVGADQVPVYSSMAKRLVSEVTPPIQTNAAEIAEEHLADKKEILKEAGLKIDTAKAPTSKTELHKINMARAFDTSGLAVLNEDMSATEHKTAANAMGLAPNFSVPHQVAPQTPPPVAADDPYGED